MIKTFLSDKINVTKKLSLFSPAHHSLLLICDSYMSWSTRFVSLKVCEGFSISDSVLFLVKFIFLFNKNHELFDKNLLVLSQQICSRLTIKTLD